MNMSPTVIASSGSTNVTFQITNNGPEDVVYVRIESDDPSAFEVGGGNADGWDSSANNSNIDYYGNTIMGNAASNFTVSIKPLQDGPGALTAFVSTNGSDFVGCGSGSLETGEAPSIFNVSLSVGSSAATITWSTSNFVPGNVNYGTTSGYGSSSGTVSGTSHSVTLSGLTAATEYHYQIQALGGITTNTSDSTFTTGAAGVTTTVTTTVTNTVTNTTTNTVNVTKTLVDSTPPSIRYKTEFKKIYEESPLTEIIVTDNTGIARIEYSTDAGVNWNPVDLENNLGDKKIDISFAPNIIEDGDYSLITKVTDTTGNKTLSKIVTFSIDRLPPRVGPTTIMMGPIIIGSDLDGTTNLLTGVNYKFIMSATGGPNKVVVNCNDQSYDLNKNPDSGFWYANMKFAQETTCKLKVKAVDGANNIQEVETAVITVNKLGKIDEGQVTVYWYDDFLNKFVVWDGSAYGQQNPIKTGSGGYGVVLPAGGKYYLEAKAFGKRTSVSNIITTSETVYINDDWELSPFWTFWQLSQEKILNPKAISANVWTSANFNLPKAKLGNFSTQEARGKTFVFGLISSWHPNTNNYLKVADEISKNKINFIPVLIQEKENSAKFLKRRGGYSLNIYADGDGEMLKEKMIQEAPTTWIVNRYGQVISTKVGEITYQDVLNEVLKTE